MKIICIGRNYVEHAQELKNEVPTEPVFFMKPDTALLPKQRAFYIPVFSDDIHHEVELVLKICKEGKHIAEEFADRYYDQVTVGIDFTARDIQQKQKEKGLPWEPAKAFDHSAPVGEFISKTELKDLNKINFRLDLNGLMVQQATNELMIFSFAKIISYVSKFITLKKGDLIFTGTPKGVSRVKPGDHLEAFLEGKKLLDVQVR
ncbi:MAG: fumarylacetoacetate hydrolase family protein [Bacteroidetes bacterium]|nr:fumarylacetoacetate hydrolase family protein [Bacteroidota bacterium]